MKGLCLRGIYFYRGIYFGEEVGAEFMSLVEEVYSFCYVLWLKFHFIDKKQSISQLGQTSESAHERMQCKDIID